MTNEEDDINILRFQAFSNATYNSCLHDVKNMHKIITPFIEASSFHPKPQFQPQTLFISFVK
jgi:hypothetical protein